MSESYNSNPELEFLGVLNDIAALASQYPEYTFEGIQPFVAPLRQEPANGPQALVQQWQQLVPERQGLILEYFRYARDKARFDTYQPLNELDQWLERLIKGPTREQLLQEGVVGKALRQMGYESPAKPPVNALPPKQSQPRKPA